MAMSRVVALGVLGVALSSTSTLCYAQTAPQAGESTAPAEGGGAEQEVIVTGIRESLAQSIDIKRNSDQIIDSIVAEDIGKLPDRNVAELLSRVSGVQVEQGIDEAKEISIRGLRQNRLEFNGRTLVSPYGRGADGPDEGAYSVLTLIPSELVGRMDVTKSPAASNIEGSIGGTVNIMTRRPSASRPFFFGASIEGVYKDKSGKLSGRGTALISKSLFDGTLGVSLGINYQRLNIRTDSFDSASGFRPFDSRFNNNPAGIPLDPNGDGSPVHWINDLRFQVLEEEREKLGLVASVNWTPSSRFRGYFDFLYARANTERERNWLSIPLSPTGSAYTQLTVDENENLIAGTFRATNVQGNGEVIQLPTNIYSGAIGGSWDVTDRLTLSGEFAYSKAQQDYTQSYLSTKTRTQQVVAFDFRDALVPAVTFPNGLDLTNPANFVFNTSFDNFFDYASKEVSGKLDLVQELDGFVRNVKLGVRYNRVNSDRGTYRNQVVFSGTSAPVTNFPGNWRVAEYPDFLDGVEGNFPRAYMIGVPLGTSDYVCEAIVPTCAPEEFDPTSSYRLVETTYAAYGQADFRSSLFGIPFSGNVGVRYVRNKVDAFGWAGVRYDLDTVRPNNQFVRYDDWLPSVSLRFEVAPRMLFRLGAARSMARADTTDLTPSFSVVESSGVATVGNPALEPFRVNSLDASLEFYPTKGAIYSLALFYKDVETFLYRRVFFEEIPGFTPDPANNPDGLFAVTRTVNGQGGKIKGFEAQMSQPLSFLPDPLDGFGVNATFTYVDSSTGILDVRTGEDLPLQGLSKYNVNLVGYYEKGPIGVRLAWNWRSKYLSSISSGGSGSYYRPYDSLSASMNFDLNENVKFYLEATNLTNTPNRRYSVFEEATQTYRLSGRTFTAGVRVRFGK